MGQKSRSPGAVVPAEALEENLCLLPLLVAARIPLLVAPHSHLCPIFTWLSPLLCVISLCLPLRRTLLMAVRAAVPYLYGTGDQLSWKTTFPWTEGWDRRWFRNDSSALLLLCSLFLLLILLHQLHLRLLGIRSQRFGTPDLGSNWIILENLPISRSFFLNYYLFYFVYVFMAIPGLHCCLQAFSSCSELGLFSHYGVWVSHCGGLSCCGTRALEHRLQ